MSNSRALWPIFFFFSFLIHTWSGISNFPLSFPHLTIKIKNPQKTSSISQSQQTSCLGENHGGQCGVMLPWLHRSDDSLQEPLGPHKSQTYEPHSPDSHFPTQRRPAPTAPSIRMSLMPQICVSVCWYWIYVLCVSFSFQTSMKTLQTHTNSDLWLIGDGRLHLISFLCRSWCGCETSSACAIRNGQAPGGWFKTCLLTNLFLCRQFRESKTLMS